MTSSQEEFDIDDYIAGKSPYDPEQGIWFKYGRVFQDAERQIADFETHLRVKLPEDFLCLIGEFCEGGFDGWYQVLKDERGPLVWTHLLLMKLPDSVDEKSEERRGGADRSHITTKILDTRSELFFENEQLTLMPFGSASRFHSDGTGLDGFLAFDMSNESRVVFVHSADCDPIPISASFSAMMNASVFLFLG